MSSTRPRRPRAVLAVSAAAVVPFLALTGSAAADVATTAVTTPSPDAVVEFTSPDPAQQTVTIRGTSTGGTAGDLVDVVCVIRVGATRTGFPVADAVAVDAAGRFEVTAPVPTMPCRLLAVPDGVDVDAGTAPAGDADLAAYAGPRVLFGAFVPFTDPDAPGVESFLSYRTQRRGVGLVGGLLAAAAGFGVDPTGRGVGLTQASILEDTTLRPVLDGGGILAGVDGDDAADVTLAQLVVDGTAAHVATQVGSERIRVRSKRLDPVSGDLEVVESAPIVLVLAGGASGPTTQPSGIELVRTLRQDHDGRVFTFHDEYRSTDGAPHRLETRYLQAAGLTANASFAYRIPWATGDAYVDPPRGTTFGGSTTTPATVYVRVDPQDEGGSPVPGTGGDAAFAYDTPITDARTVYPGALLTRVVRDVPAGGMVVVSQRLVQATSPAELEQLLRDTAPASGPPSEAPAPSVPIGAVSIGLPPFVTPQPFVTPPPFVAPRPVRPAASPLTRLQAATRKALLKRGQGARLRGRKAVTVALDGVPAGRYAVTVRRGSTRGPRIAGATTVLRANGTVRLRLRLDAAGRRYFATATGRRTRSLRAAVMVSWIPEGASARTRSSRYLVRVR